MDKFGIFNLLNSLINLNGSKTTETTSSSNELSPTLQNFITALKGNNSMDTASVNNQSSKSNTPPPATMSKPPLQSAMLSTMRSHDEFIKRVKTNNNHSL